MKDNKMSAKIGVVMGSQSDWSTMKNTVDVIDSFNIPYELNIVSAHRTPNRLYEYAKQAEAKGIKVIIAESYERIHRSNLIGMGILPLQFINGKDRLNLKLKGSELMSIINLEKGIEPSHHVEVEIKYASGDSKKIKTLCRIDTKNELEYYKNGGILQYVLRNMF